MDSIGIEINTVAFEAAMQRLRDGVRRGIIAPNMGTLSVQGRLLAERCRTFTPPRNLGQGKAAVAKDIMGLYFPLSHTTFTDSGIKKIVRTDDRQAWNVISPKLSSTHGLRNTTAIGFSPGLHHRMRNRRGRVKVKYQNIGYVTLGQEGRKSRAYLKSKQKLVGWARAGWNAAIWGLGGNLGPSWISRHGAQGRLTDGRMSADPYIYVLNDSSWAKNRKEGERIVRNAITARARDMESYYFRMMKLAATQAQAA